MPALSEGAPDHARLKPSVPGDTSSYDLSFTDKGGNYAFAGARNFADDQYVLYFDPKRKAFILDRVESTFDMNLTRLPNNSDPASLARKYPHLGSEAEPNQEPAKKAVDSEVRKSAVKARPNNPLVTNPPKRKADKKQAPKNVDLALPVPEKPKPKARKPAMEEEEDEDEDDDGGLLVEYPGAAPQKRTDFSPAFPSVRKFDEFMDQRESEGDDADGESDDELETDFKLPSPVNNHSAPTQPQQAAEPEPEPMDVDNGGDDEEEADDDNADFDLEKDMEMAFEDLNNSHRGSDESEISEED